MKEKIVILASKRGFCSGVERALKAVDEALKTGPHPVYVLHEIVHNEHIVEQLRRKGVFFIEEPEEAESGTLIFSAHGVSREVEARAEALGIHLVDATCGIVKSLHHKAEKFERSGMRILLFGKKGHREIEGVLGRVSCPVTVLENKAAVSEFLNTLTAKERNECHFGCLSQTTLNSDDVLEMRRLLSESLTHLEVDADVCFATRDRQNAVKELAAKCGLVLIVGSAKSSNSRRLCETAASCGAEALLISDPGCFDPAVLERHTAVGVSSGASAPEELVTELLEILRRSGFQINELRSMCHGTRKKGMRE